MTISYKPILVAIIATCAIIFAIFPQTLMTGEQARTFAIVLVTLSLWATAIIPGYLASLLFFAVALILKLAPPATVFSGFYSTAIWLVFAGFVIAAAVNKSGLSEKLGAHLSHYLTGSYLGLIGGLYTVSALLSFVMPSSLGRFFLMAPIAFALADQIGFAKGTKGRTAIALAVTFACHLPGFAVLPSNVPNLVLAGAAETIYGINFQYLDYLVLHFPVLGILRSIIIVALIVRLFPDTPQIIERKAAREPSPVTPRQWYVIAVLLITLAFWLTDSIHGINPAWVGLCTSIALMLPRIGPVQEEEFKNSVSFGVIIFTAGILAVGAVVNVTGLGTVIAHGLEYVLPMEHGHDFLNFVSLSFMAFFTALLTILPGVPAVLTPMAAELSDLTGLSLTAVLMTQVIGFSTVLFPYQSGPLTVGMLYSGEPVSRLLKLTIPLTVITGLVLVPLDFLWWKLLGII